MTHPVIGVARRIGAVALLRRAESAKTDAYAHIVAIRLRASEYPSWFNQQMMCGHQTHTSGTK